MLLKKHSRLCYNIYISLICYLHTRVYLRLMYSCNCNLTFVEYVADSELQNKFHFKVVLELVPGFTWMTYVWQLWGRYLMYRYFYSWALLSGCACAFCGSQRKGSNTELYHENIRIFNGCEVKIENSVTRVTVQQPIGSSKRSPHPHPTPPPHPTLGKATFPGPGQWSGKDFLH